MSAIKIPLQRIITLCLDSIRTRTTATDAVLIIIDQKTGEFKVSSMRGHLPHMAELVRRTADALEKQKNPTGLILPH